VAMTYDELDRRHGRHWHHRHHHGDDRHCGPHRAFRRMRDSLRRRTRLTRDVDQGMLAGVCAGIARHLGLRPKVVRIAAVVSLILFTIPTVIAYVLIAWLAPARDEDEPLAAARPDHSAPDAGPAGGSVEGLARLKNRFRRLEEKFADIEAQVMNDGPA
jgi:phage shock protein C